MPTFVISLSIGIGFLLAGYWLILPFAGLELLLVSAALISVRLSGCQRERVTISADVVTIAKERGGHRAEPDWTFQRAWARVVLSRPVRGFDPSQLFIRSHGRAVELGRFLPENERKQLAQELGVLLGPLP